MLFIKNANEENLTTLSMKMNTVQISLFFMDYDHTFMCCQNRYYFSSVKPNNLRFLMKEDTYFGTIFSHSGSLLFILFSTL